MSVRATIVRSLAGNRHRIGIAVLMAAAGLLVFAAPAPAVVEDDSLAARVDRLLPAAPGEMTSGVAVVLVDGGDTVLERCYGLADVEHAVPVTPATRFELASVSKTFTGFGVLLLVQQGRLGLDDDIRRYLPELPDHGVAVTIRHLLNQTSGLPDWVRLFPYMGIPYTDRVCMRDLLAMLQHLRTLSFTPGSRWSYSNTNYALLAEIIRRVTEKPFGEWMAEQIFLPLEMEETSFPFDGTELIPNRANAYTRREGRIARSLMEGFRTPGAAHAFSTLRDMAKWIDNFRTGKVGGAELIREMRREGRLNSGEETFYAAGVGVGEYRGVATIGHSGSTGGFKSELIYCPDVGVGVVVLANDATIRADRLARAVLDLYLGDRLAPEPVAATVSTTASGQDQASPRPFLPAESASLNRFVGAYHLEEDPSALVCIGREGDHLAGILTGKGMDLFLPIGPAEFENRLRNTQLSFSDEDADGRPRRLRAVLKGQEMLMVRTPCEQHSARSEEYVGAYYCDEWGTIYEIARAGDEFLIRHRELEDRPLQEVEPYRLAGGMGMLTFIQTEQGRVEGFIFEEPEDLPGMRIEFVKVETR